MGLTTARQSISTNTYTSSAYQEDTTFKFFHLIYNSDATVGNRQIRVEMLDSSGNVIWDARAGAVQAASLTRDYAFMPGTYRESSFIDGQIHVPYPMDMVLPANHRFKVYDANNVSASDTMVLSFQIAPYYSDK